MKHNIKYILSVCIGIALTMGLSAQTLNSSYFMEKRSMGRVPVAAGGWDGPASGSSPSRSIGSRNRVTEHPAS